MKLSGIPASRLSLWSFLPGITFSLGLYAQIETDPLVSDHNEPVAVHVEQQFFVDLIEDGEETEAFQQAFDIGDELFEAQFNSLDGSGANVGNGLRFTRVPRADLTGPGEWANHIPARPTGPNAQACNECHSLPFDDGAGFNSANAHRDPDHTGIMNLFITRNTPHLFGIGAIQRLAEEMTEELIQLRTNAEAEACSTGENQTVSLISKGSNFGSLEVSRTVAEPCETEIDTSNIAGVNDDLVILPLQWKGSDLTIRAFNRDASNNEIGMQAVELVGDDVDGDFDGVVNEMTIGDQTALAIYLAGQPRPTTKIELNELGLETLTTEEITEIESGEAVFAQSECASCHKPSMTLSSPVFSEPSQSAHYRDSVFPAGQDPVSSGVAPETAVTFDLTQDLPDNIITLDDGGEFMLGNFLTDEQGATVVSLFGDLKRHDLGEGLAETIDEAGTGASTWLTTELWGVGSTGPYLHDGRATTLTEAILAHGGAAQSSRDEFVAMSPADQQSMLAFLDNLVLYKLVEEEVAETEAEVTENEIHDSGNKGDRDHSRGNRGNKPKGQH